MNHKFGDLVRYTFDAKDMPDEEFTSQAQEVYKLFHDRNLKAVDGIAICFFVISLLYSMIAQDYDAFPEDYDDDPEEN
jgi:hypothetical protein